MTDERRERPPRRITLKWAAEPLRLPGEPSASVESPSASLENDAPPLERAEPDRARLLADDGWQRLAPERPMETRAQAHGDALELVDRRSRPVSTPELPVEMSERFALGDYTAALSIAELLLGRDPSDRAAGRIAARSRAKLEELYLSRLGSLAAIPEVAVDAAELRWLGLDPRATSLLSRIEGEQTLAELLEISGMSAIETLSLLVELLELGAITLPR